MNDNWKFKAWYSSLDDECRLRNRDLIIKKCGITSTTVFYNWYSGRTLIPYLAKIAIEEVAGEKIFN